MGGLRSMTGFASAEGALEDGRVVFRWDAKSVNGRGLDVKIRAPSGFEAEEPGWRVAAGRRLARGSVSLSLQVTEAPTETELRLNETALAAAAAWATAAERAIEASGARSRGVSPEGLLQVRGVLDGGERRADGRVEGPSEPLRKAVAATLETALDGLEAARAAEGARLHDTLARLIDEIAQLTKEAEARAAARGDGVKARLAEKVAALLEAGAPVEEGRLAQELALIATRIDVREELDRLCAHIEAARTLIDGDAPAGRKLDFLAQEFNREANTLCAKAQDPALTETGLALKVAIDQLKEQAANVE